MAYAYVAPYFCNMWDCKCLIFVQYSLANGMLSDAHVSSGVLLCLKMKYMWGFDIDLDLFNINRCTFMNFARNVKCLECEGARPRRQLTGREWECPR